MSERNHLSAYCFSMSHAVHCCTLQISNPIKFQNKHRQPHHCKTSNSTAGGGGYIYIYIHIFIYMYIYISFFFFKSARTAFSCISTAARNSHLPPLTLRFSFRNTTFADFHLRGWRRLVCARPFTGSVLHRCWFTQEMAHAA